MRAASRYPIAVVHKPLVRYRQHGENMTTNLDRMELSLKLLTERMLRLPDNYAPGAGQFYLERLKGLFVETAAALRAEKVKRPLPSNKQKA